MKRIGMIAVAVILAGSIAVAAPQPAAPANKPVKPKTPAELAAEVESLKAEVAALRAEVAALRASLPQDRPAAGPGPSAPADPAAPAVVKGMSLDDAAAAAHSTPTLLRDVDGVQYYSLGDNRFYYQVTVEGGKIVTVSARPQPPTENPRLAPADVRRFPR